MTENTKDLTMIIGVAAFPGVARGLAFVCGCGDDIIVPRRTIDASETLLEMERFAAPISAVEQDLLRLRQVVPREIGKSEAEWPVTRRTRGFCSGSAFEVLVSVWE
jgi:phosphoenolpyruvate-protein kinase (PTS system EI component)